jgi:hypothetical protein
MAIFPFSLQSETKYFSFISFQMGCEFFHVEIGSASRAWIQRVNWIERCPLRRSDHTEKMGSGIIAATTYDLNSKDMYPL